MTHPQQNREEQGSSFTITQFALGSPLQFEPALGSQELDRLITNYVPGSALPRQKRAQVVLEFLNSIDALSYSHPISIRYHVPQVLTPQMIPRHSSLPSLNSPPPRASYNHSNAREEMLGTSKSTPSLKRSREEVASPNASSAKRLPGFSIMTRDGTDITDLASRGPKTKEQRDHAALMRKLKACAACKKSKQRCDPSHHRPAQTVLNTPTTSSATPSNRSARFSCVSSNGGSQGSISPQSSLGESFSQSPSRCFSDRAVAQVGQGFPPFSTPKPSLSPSDFTLPDTLLHGSDLPTLSMQDFDPELFQLADMNLDSWNSDFTAFPPTGNQNAWNSHEDIFAPTHGYEFSAETQRGSSSEQFESASLPHVATSLEHVLPGLIYHERLARQPDRQLRDANPDPHGVDFDIDQWLTDREGRKDSQPLGATTGDQTNVLERNLRQRSLQNPLISRDQDYILYPDSPKIDWGLEPHLISRDIGNKEWLQRKQAGSGTLSDRHIDKPSDEQNPNGPVSAGTTISGSNRHVPIAESTQVFAADHASRLRAPSRVLSQVQARVDDGHDPFLAEGRQRPRRSIISADLPGEDEMKKSFSVGTIMQQHRILNPEDPQPQYTPLSDVLEPHRAQQEYLSTRPRSADTLNRKMITIITLCMLMTISLMWTIPLLITASNKQSENSVSQQSDKAILYGLETRTTFRNNQNDVRTVSLGHGSGSPSESGSVSGLDHSTSKEDFLYSGPDHVLDKESNPILEPRPVAENSLANESFISETNSGRGVKQSTDSPVFSSLPGVPTPSTINHASTWTTHVPARPTLQPKEVYMPVTVQSQRHLPVRSSSSRIYSDLKRSWTRRFNIGHLSMKITSLTIL